MNYARNTEIIRKHFQDHQENVCIAVLSIILLCKTFIFNKGYFLFKELSKIFKDLCGKFKDFSRISHNCSIFKDMTFFQGLFKACANHVNLSDRNQKVRCEWKLKFQMQGTAQLNL